jgi:hypothetical protein
MSTKRELVTNSVVPRIKAVLTAAEQTAALVAEEAESEASRRVSELLAGADADADRIRREATRRVEEYLAASRRRIDAFATARIERIAELTEGVIEASASIQDRFEQAASIQREVHAMVEALGSVAEAVAREASMASPELPRPPAGSTLDEGGPSWAQTGPDGSVVGEVRPGERASRSPESEGDSSTADEKGSADELELDLNGLGEIVLDGAGPTGLDGVSETDFDDSAEAEHREDSGTEDNGEVDHDDGETTSV